MTMPEILRRKLMERIDIASEPDDGEVLEEIDRLILGEEETRYLPCLLYTSPSPRDTR